MRRWLFAVLGLVALSAGRLAAADPIVRVTIKGPKGEPVADAVVMLVPLDRPAPPAEPSPPRVEVAQEDEQYNPYLTVIRAGTAVEFPNKDRIQHHLYSVSEPKKFEKPLYGPGRHETVVFDRPGVVTVGCNIHDWMIAYIVVVDTPWHGRSESDGLATVAAPAGRYRLEVWHPRLVDERKKQRTTPVARELMLTGGGGAEEFTLALAAERRIRRAPATKGGRY